MGVIFSDKFVFGRLGYIGEWGEYFILAVKDLGEVVLLCRNQY